MDPISLALAILPGLFGASAARRAAEKSRVQAVSDASNKFVDLRDAAIRGGFNPLTALEATGGAGFGAYPSSAPPLASVELLTGALQSGAEELSGVASQRRAADRLNLDLAQLRLDQARSGVVAYSPVSAARNVGAGPSPLGRSAITVAAKASAGHDASLGPVRPINVIPTSNTGGYFQMENGFTGGSPVNIPGDSEPWGIDELATAVIVGAPQVFNNYMNNGAQWVYDKVTPYTRKGWDGAVRAMKPTPQSEWTMPNEFGWMQNSTQGFN